MRRGLFLCQTLSSLLTGRRAQNDIQRDLRCTKQTHHFGRATINSYILIFVMYVHMQTFQKTAYKWVQTSFRVHWDKQQTERKAEQVFGRFTHKWDANPVLVSAAASPRLLSLNGSVGDSGIQTGLLHKHTDPSSASQIKLFVAVLWWCCLLLAIIRFLFSEDNVRGCC